MTNGKVTYYTEAHVQQMQRVIDELTSQNSALESLRPHWAQWYTSDSIAAQSSTAALSQVWRVLGVSNQTDAMEKLRLLLGIADADDGPDCDFYTFKQRGKWAYVGEGRIPPEYDVTRDTIMRDNAGRIPGLTGGRAADFFIAVIPRSTCKSPNGYPRLLPPEASE